MSCPALRSSVLAFAVLAAAAVPALAADAGRPGSPSPSDRLMIVDGNRGRVIYDDGRDDLFCVTRRRVVGYYENGYPIRRRTMHCR